MFALANAVVKPACRLPSEMKLCLFCQKRGDNHLVKKLFLFLIFIAGVAALGFLQADLGNIFGSAKIRAKSYYVDPPIDAAYINAAPFYIVDGFDGKSDAQSFSFTGTAAELLPLLSALNARQVYAQNIEGIAIAHYFCDSLPRVSPVTIDGKKSNMQIALRGDVVTVGFPIIVGSF